MWMIAIASLLALAPYCESPRTASEEPSTREATGWETLREQLLERGLRPDRVPLPAEVTNEMEEWARRWVEMGTPRGTAEQLLDALITDDGLGLDYSPAPTGTAIEVFESRRANCLAFTHLYIGLSRALGLPTYYVAWDRVVQFKRQGDLVVVSGHIGAAHKTAEDVIALQFGAADGLEVSGMIPISDLEATARHYANRSAELLADGDVQGALDAGEIAVRMEPSFSDGWVNLGVARRRSGDWSGAEQAYLRSTETEPDNLAAYQNLAALLHMRGEEDAATRLLQLLSQRGSRNPYLYLGLGNQSLAAGRIDEAGRYYKRAHRYGSDLAEIRAACGLWRLELGDRRRATRWLRRAQAVDPTDETTRHLATRLELSTPPRDPRVDG